MASTAGDSGGTTVPVVSVAPPVPDLFDVLPEVVARLTESPEIQECGACQEYLAAALDLLRAHLRPVVRAPSATPVMVPLTLRERDVLTHLAGGMTARQIARQLAISDTTVRKHLEHAYAKLGVHDRLTATIRMRELDLLPPAQ
ncbi:MAG: LuxR C-terminal-related transcriptional regulator [Actinomycetia bacterium]|nr:LuxR C-terminal-related transcriptional regulator [Actinomycetes bacterium]